VSIRDQIAPLEELATIDDDLRRLEEQIGKQRGSLEGMRAEAKVLEERLRSDREMLSQMEKTRSELSVELRQMTQQIERSREKLARSRNERESNAAQREIEELRKLHRDREEEIERLNTATDAAKKSIDVTDAKHRNIVQQIEGTVEGTTRQLDDAESQRAHAAPAPDRGHARRHVPRLPPDHPADDVPEDAAPGRVRAVPALPPHPLLHARAGEGPGGRRCRRGQLDVFVTRLIVRSLRGA